MILVLSFSLNIYDVKYMITFFSLQEYTRMNHSTVKCVMSAWTNILGENTSADLILAKMNALSA